MDIIWFWAVLLTYICKHAFASNTVTINQSYSTHIFHSNAHQ